MLTAYELPVTSPPTLYQVLVQPSHGVATSSGNELGKLTGIPPPELSVQAASARAITKAIHVGVFMSIHRPSGRGALSSAPAAASGRVRPCALRSSRSPSPPAVTRITRRRPVTRPRPARMRPRPP